MVAMDAYQCRCRTSWLGIRALGGHHSVLLGCLSDSILAICPSYSGPYRSISNTSLDRKRFDLLWYRLGFIQELESWRLHNDSDSFAVLFNYLAMGRFDGSIGLTPNTRPSV